SCSVTATGRTVYGRGLADYRARERSPAPEASRSGRRAGADRHRDLAQLARADVVDETGRGERVRKQVRLADAQDARAHALLHVGERLEVDPARVGARLAGQLLAQLLVRERQHPAVGVADHEGLLFAEQPVRDDERP